MTPMPAPAPMPAADPLPAAVPPRRWLRRLASVLWAGFLVAAALELAVFAFVDPQALHGLGGEALALSSTAVYSLAFFVFWAVAAAGAALSLLLDSGSETLHDATVQGAAPAPPR